MYLTREANFAIFRSIARFAAQGSELVFTYVEQKRLDSDSQFMRPAKAAVAAVGEPWLSASIPRRSARNFATPGWNWSRISAERNPASVTVRPD